MSTIKLNIYKADVKNEIEKTYEVEGYDLMFGTVEDFIGVIDLEKMNNEVEIIKAVMGCLGQLKPLLLDVFEDLTEDELKRTKVKELIPCLVDIIKSTASIMADFINNSVK